MFDHVQTCFFRTVTCLDFLESGDVIGGDDSGAVRTYSVSIEGEYYMSHEFEAHSKGVNAILALGSPFQSFFLRKHENYLTFDLINFVITFSCEFSTLRSLLNKRAGLTILRNFSSLLAPNRVLLAELFLTKKYKIVFCIHFFNVLMLFSCFISPI